LRNGYNVKILSLSNVNNGNWFPNQEVEIISYTETKKILKSGQIGILIATSYSTAFTVDMASAKIKYYFVQSDESRFFPEDDAFCEKIKKTYELPFIYMTEARWIQKWLKDDFGHESYYLPNGIDLDTFKKVEPIEPNGNKSRILIEGAIDIPYKGMQDAYDAIKDLDCEIWIVSNNGKPKKGWRYDRFFENVPYGEMNKIYSSCDIFLKMSRIEGFFGPPMEAMACGCAVVVGKVTGYDEYIIDGKNALVVDSGDIKGAKKAVQKLIDNKLLKNKLIKGGIVTVKEWSWDKSFDYLENIFKNMK
jgi:glycosyltransferase involved in cell wall biosynthesis